MAESLTEDDSIDWNAGQATERNISWTESIIMWALFALVIWAVSVNVGFPDLFSCIAGFSGGFILCLWSRIGTNIE